MKRRELRLLEEVIRYIEKEKKEKREREREREKEKKSERVR